MRSCLLHLVTAILLLQCGAAAALWVRSYWVWEAVAVSTEAVDTSARTHTDRMLKSIDGRLSYHVTTSTIAGVESLSRTAYSGHRWRYVRNDPQPMTPFTWWERHRPAVTGSDDTDSRGNTTSVRSLHLPYWLLVPLLAIAPGGRLWNRRRRARRHCAGRCPGCGYDWRATPGRCPECGNIPAVGEAAQVQCVAPERVGVDDPPPTTVDYFTPPPRRGWNRRNWISLAAGVLALLVAAFYLGLCVAYFASGEHRR